MSKSSSPIITAGMHRSGTSLLTSVLAASGVDVGERLVPADRHNQRGYFEDVDFLTLNRRILVECSDANDGGHPDWGWTESESLDTERFADYREEACGLLAVATAREERWGFKDPRASLLLDFWHELIEDPRYLLVYRLPWDVADSMQRLGADVFLRHPEYALRIWTYYNRHLLDFYSRHRDRTLLVSTNALLNQPEIFGRLLRERLDLELDQAALERLYDVPLLATSEPQDPLIGLVAATSPEAVELLSLLDASADLPADGYWKRPKKLQAPSVGRSERPRVSVVIPCRDHGQLLIETIASVERCLEDEYELLVIDDGSTQQRTLQVLDKLREAGYRILRQEPSGLSAARNHGIGEASADYILPLDADNRLRKGFLEEAVALLDDGPELGAVYGEPWEFGLREGRREVGELDIDELLEANYIDACALIRKAMWWDVGGYDEALPAWEDWDFWIRVATRGWAAKKLDIVAFDYRVRPNSLVSITEQEEVLDSIVDHVTGKHRQLFHGHLTRRLGHVLAAWPRSLERKRQQLSQLIHELREEKLEQQRYMRQVEDHSRSLESSVAALRLELERARIERLEIEKEIEEAGQSAEQSRLHAEQEMSKTYHQLERACLEAERETERANVRCEQVRSEAEQEMSKTYHQLERACLETEREAERANVRCEQVRSEAEQEAQRSYQRLENARSEAEREAERAEWRLQHMRLSTEKARTEAEVRDLLLANQQQDLASQDHQLSELRQLANEQHEEAQRLKEQLSQAGSSLARAQRQAGERLKVLEEIHASRAFTWVRRWWRLIERFKNPRQPADSPVSAAASPVEDGVLGR